jgi:hypothetical protein
MPAIPKHAVATELLDRALRLYFEGDSYFAALHLAGAAEEVLAVYIRGLKEDDGEPLVPAFDSLREAAALLAEREVGADRKVVERRIGEAMNEAKNSTKHKRGRSDEFVDFDARTEAKQMLDFAVANYYQLAPSLGLAHTPLLERFNDELRGA